MIPQYPIEDLIIISREQKKESQPIAKVILCYRLAFFFLSVSAKLNQKISHICQVQSDADNPFEF